MVWGWACYFRGIAQENRQFIRTGRSVTCHMTGKHGTRPPEFRTHRGGAAFLQGKEEMEARRSAATLAQAEASSTQRAACFKATCCRPSRRMVKQPPEFRRRFGSTGPQRCGFRSWHDQQASMATTTWRSNTTSAARTVLPCHWRRG